MASQQGKSFKKLHLNTNYPALFFLFSFLCLLPGQNLFSTIEINSHAVENFSVPQIPLSFYPQENNKQTLPELTAKAYLVMDVDSAVMMTQKDARQRVYPASTTKMMTALVSLENYPLSSIVTVGDINTPSQKINLRPAEKISVENLLYGMLISSGNDAAEALALAYPEGRDGFISKMNERAKELHLLDTHFKNPTGIDEEGHYSSALDLARLAIYALHQDEFKRIVSTAKASVFSSDGKIEHRLNNVNELLGKVDGVMGIKTGYTQKAGESLVALTQREGHQIITVVMGSKDRFKETKSLIEWAFSSHDWINPENVLMKND